MTDDDEQERERFDELEHVRALTRALGIVGVWWPYGDDLQLRQATCPQCGDPGRLLVGTGVVPAGFCGDESCRVFMWDPLRPAAAQLADAVELVESPSRESPPG